MRKILKSCLVLFAAGVVALGPMKGQVDVGGGTPDTTPPTLQGFEFTPNVINGTSGPQVVTFTIRWRDEQSGFMQGAIRLRSPSNALGINGGFFAFQRISGDS